MDVEADKFANLLAEIGRMVQTRFPGYEFAHVSVRDLAEFKRVVVDVVFEFEEKS